MGFYDTINTVLGPVLNPFLSLNPLLAIVIISFLLALIITVIYKYMTDQELMRTLKEDIKVLQKEMKQLRNNPAKMMEVQKKAMDKNMKYMMHSMKPTLVTFVPLILIFGWLSANFAYDPIAPGEKFSTYIFFENDEITSASISVPEGITLLSNKVSETKKIDKSETAELFFSNKDITAKRYGGVLEKGVDVYYAGWELKGEEGLHTIEYVADSQSYFKDALISNIKYNKPIEKVEDGKVKGILVDQGKLIVLNLFGWKLGWLGTYIIFSIIFSMGLRKVLKIH